MLGSKETGECVIVDPLLDIDFIVNEAKKEGYDRITRVIDTHTHRKTMMCKMSWDNTMPRPKPEPFTSLRH